MAKKLGPPLVLGVFTILALVFLTGGATDDKDPLRENFKINAIYYDAGYVFPMLINLIKLILSHLKFLEWKPPSKKHFLIQNL